jgi:lipopolysaccharide transport system permease protein
MRSPPTVSQELPETPATEPPPIPRAPLVHVEEGRRPIWWDVRQAWRSRGLIPWFAAKVLIRKIVGTKLAWAWLVIRPLMDTVGKALIFGGLLKVGAPNAIPYFVFLMVGMVGWRLFERIVYWSTRSFDVFNKFMKSLDFPLLLVPISAAAYPAVEVAVYVAVLVGALAYYVLTEGTLYLRIGPELVVAAAGIGIAVVAAFGIALWTSVLNGKARDMRFIIRYVLDFWLYLTPVIYPLTAVPPAYRPLAAINPMTQPIEMIKFGLIGAGRVEMRSVIWSVSFALLMVISGLWYFNREASRSVDLHGGGAEEDDEM